MPEPNAPIGAIKSPRLSDEVTSPQRPRGSQHPLEDPMHSLAHDYPTTLLAEREAPCLSLYQPTHRQHPDNAQDPVRREPPHRGHSPG